jgi:hypothetical protein
MLASYDSQTTSGLLNLPHPHDLVFVGLLLQQPNYLINALVLSPELSSRSGIQGHHSGKSGALTSPLQYQP